MKALTWGPTTAGLKTMDIAAVLTKVVQEQQRMLNQQQDKIFTLENALQFKKDKDLSLAQVGGGIRQEH